MKPSLPDPDQDLRVRFQALRAEDHARCPPLQLPAGAFKRQAVRPSFLRLPAGLSLAAAAAVAIALLLAGPWRSPPPSLSDSLPDLLPNEVEADWLASISSARRSAPPSDYLLPAHLTLSMP